MGSVLTDNELVTSIVLPAVDTASSIVTGTGETRTSVCSDMGGDGEIWTLFLLSSGCLLSVVATTLLVSDIASETGISSSSMLGSSSGFASSEQVHMCEVYVSGSVKQVHMCEVYHPFHKVLYCKIHMYTPVISSMVADGVYKDGDIPLFTVLALDTTLANNCSTPVLSIGFFIISAKSPGNAEDTSRLLLLLVFSVTSNKSTPQYSNNSNTPMI